MSAVRAPSPRRLTGPGLVYFWGPVRAHVNRVALEYAARLSRRPVWISVPDGPPESLGPERGQGRSGVTIYALRPGDEVDRASPSEGASETGPSGGTSVPLDQEVGRYLRFPVAARAALREVSHREAPGVLILTNLDRLRHLGALTDPALTKVIFDLLRPREIVVIVTSEGLVHAPALPVECAFRVDSTPEEAWYDAELYPGTPVSCCTSCAGSRDRSYATCSPAFRSVCPLSVPFGRAFEGTAQTSPA